MKVSNSRHQVLWYKHTTRHRPLTTPQDFITAVKIVNNENCIFILLCPICKTLSYEISLYRWDNCGLEKISDLSKFT